MSGPDRGSARRASPDRERLRLSVRGIVQGVGFRPTVVRHARRLGVAGYVANSPAGVTIEAEADHAALERFVRSVLDAPPPGARIAGAAVEAIPPTGEPGFEVRASAQDGAPTTGVLPDLATCDACLAELFDPRDRRHRYPFTNCTQCGPRYSIVERLPYDRARTSMRRFPMCPACQAEYEDPENRRFHAEPNACPVCGPRLEWWEAEGVCLAAEAAALQAAVRALRAGGIVAVKGLGGFHLMVDARDDAAVRRLRERKAREEKPFAVMFPSRAAVAQTCDPPPAAWALLESPERPIVLVARTGGALAASVAPSSPYVGALLPYTPLHHLLLAELGFPVVATSGNRSEEPIVTDERDACVRLGGIADAFLVHDRPIVRPLDDSVARIVDGEPMLLRRARGYAPAVAAEGALPDGIVAFGGHMKTTVAVTRGGGIVLGPHLGDLDTPEARDAYTHGLADLVHLAGVQPRLAAHDLHPEYHSTRVAREAGTPTQEVQHHLAHVAACMAEHGLGPPVLGVAWDGTGFGPDGTVWGGEFLEVTRAGWRRVAHLRTFPLPGGEAAVREPRRAALGVLFEAYGPDVAERTDLPAVAAFAPHECRALIAMLARDVRAPRTSSVGRLFDAVAALLGLRQRASYEGQAAAELESAAATWPHAPRRYACELVTSGPGPWILDWEPLLAAVLADIHAGVPAGAIAAAFHRALANAIADVAARAGIADVALGGGCFQNACLTEATIHALRARDLRPWWPRRVPPNDGGLALGQAAWAARTLVGGTL